MAEMWELDHVQAAERIVLGALMGDINAYYEAIDELEIEDFSLDSNRVIYREMLEVQEDGADTTQMLLLLIERMQKYGTLERVGAQPYLFSLTEDLPHRLQIEEQVRIVRSASLRRQAAKVYHGALARAMDGYEDPLLLMAEISEKTEKIAAGRGQKRTLEAQVVSAVEAIRRARQGEHVAFLSSGIEGVDAVLEGWAVGEMTVIAARPNVGKSPLLRQSIATSCKSGIACHLFSPEVNAEKTLNFMACMESKVPFRRIRHPERMNVSEMANFEAAMRSVAQWPLEINDSPRLKPREIISGVRSSRRRQKTKLVGIDYLQKLSFDGNTQSRHVDVTDAMVQLTQMGKTEGVAVLLVSSLTEPPDKQKNRIPTMHDLRQSGDIKYEADTIVLMHREIDEETQRMAPETSLIFGKTRFDQPGIRKAYFDSDTISFGSQKDFLNRHK